MTFKAIAFAITAVLGTSAAAQNFTPVQDRAQFVDLVSGKDLRLALYGITLNVSANGQISGQAVGAPVTGNWSWEGGFFCRDMDWGDRNIGYNCQLVEVGGNQMRFTVDRGAGQSAVFTIR